MQSELTDAESIDRSLRQPEAFVAVFERHYACVHNHLRRRVGQQLADDLAAETFARAFRARARFEARHDTARPWLFGICANLVRDHRRAEARRFRALERLASESPSAEPALQGLEARWVVALRRLARRDREALLLHAWAELSYEEIGTALGIPIGTVRSRLHRARRQLREQLAADESRDQMIGEAHA